MTAYPLPLPYLRVLIGGTDFTSYVLSRSLRVHNILGGQNNTCSLEMKPPESWRGTAAQAPTVGQEIAVEISSTSATGPWERVFGGTISRVSSVRIAAGTIKWVMQCRDYTELLNRVLVNQTYVAQSISTIVADIVRTCAPTIILDGNTQTVVTQIDAITFAYQQASDCLDYLAQAVGYNWFIDAYKVLHFYDSTTLRTSSQSLTDTSNNFWNLVIEPQLDQVRNRIYVQGGTCLTTLSEEFIADGRRDWKLSYAPAIMDISTINPTTRAVTTTSAMTIGGIWQTVGLQGTTDESQVAFLFDDKNGHVYSCAGTPTPADMLPILFTYQALVPIAVMREDLNSQVAVAVLESGSYSAVVMADRPLHYFRLNEKSGATFVNVTQGTTFRATTQGTVELGVAGALNADSDTAVRFDGRGWIQGASGVQIPRAQCTIEAWVQTQPSQPSQGLVSHMSSGTGGISVGVTTDGYELLTRLPNGTEYPIQSNIKPTGGGYDYVVGQYDGTSGSIWVNNFLRASAVCGVPGPVAVSGIEIGDNYYNLNGGKPRQFSGTIDEVAIYDYVLSGSRIAAHYQAGRYAGVREYVVTDNSLQGFDDARKAGDLALSQWANVMVQFGWQSFVSGWQIGDSVPINITATPRTGLGRTYAGTALIQEIDFEWVGAQRIIYTIRAAESRYNFIDYQRALASLTHHGETLHGQVATLNYIKSRSSQFVMVDGPVALVITAPPPYLVQPDWAVATLPKVEAERWDIWTDWG